MGQGIPGQGFQSRADAPGSSLGGMWAGAGGGSGTGILLCWTTWNIVLEDVGRIRNWYIKQIRGKSSCNNRKKERKHDRTGQFVLALIHICMISVM